MNIRLRLTLWYTTILCLILILFSAAVYIGLSRSLFTVIDNQLQREAAQVIGQIRIEKAEEDDDDEEDEGRLVAQEPFVAQIQGFEVGLGYTPEEGFFWRVLDTAGRPVFDPGYFIQAELDPTNLTPDQIRFDYTSLADDTPVRLYTAPFVIEQRGGGFIQIAESYQYIRDVQQQLIVLLAFSLPIILIVASAGGWFLASRALTPIDRITRSAQQMSANDLHQRLNLKLPNDEVGRLAETFDQMLARLENAFERQKRFIADASHEMRTPLTILKGDVEVALNRPRRVEEYQETLQMVNQTADRLSGLVEELFLLARADNNQYPLQVNQIDLSLLLMEEVAHLQPRAIRNNIALDLDVPDTLPLTADPEKVARLFINLIDNAIKHSTPGAAVTIAARSENGFAQVDISDTGPGIPAEHLPHLFERFYRVDRARSRQGSTVNGGSGAGLGLSIAQWLAQLHGGAIEVTSRLDQGTTFAVRLPLEPPDR